MLPTQLSKIHVDLADAFVENERQTQETQQAMANVESVSKKPKFSTFFDGNWLEFFCGKNHSACCQLIGVPSISAKILAFPILLLRQDSNVYTSSSKKSKI